MNYQQTIEYLYSRLPIYQNKGITAYKADIGNISKASNLLGNPHNKFKSIHVA
jgi:dihydrofolate synthase/folylpolyglutamate synthase